MIRSTRHLSKWVPKCPPPEYDTGCTFCSIPEFPSDKQIDFSKDLLGTTNVPWKHVLLLSHGISNFDTMPSKIETIPGSLSSEITVWKRDLISPYHPVMVSNILLNNHEKVLEKFGLGNQGDSLVYLYPDHKVVKFDMANTKEFIQKYLVPEGFKEEPVYNPFKLTPRKRVVEPEIKGPAKEESVQEIAEQEASKFTEYPIDSDLVLICGHTQRDIRCGQLAPLLKNEFEHVLEKEGVAADVGLVSHIGGHAYAGNVIYFPKTRDAQGVWYGRVFPDRVQGVVRETILKGNVIRELYRGAEDTVE